MSMFMEFWQAHFPIFSILLPMTTAIILILLGNPGAACLQADWRQPIRHIISWVSGILGLLLAIGLVNHALSGEIKIYELSEWSAPFGIVLVVDRLAALMVTLTYVLALPILWYASAQWDQRGRYFHAMVHFLLMGISGAFLTGDLFNLFVFFEVLLMASYVLLLHSHTKRRFQLGVHYVIINLVASSIFLIGLGMIYANVGSLNMADVARLMPTLEVAQHQMALVGGMLLFVVFGIKAAMLPVGFWLPKTYAVAATPVAALFALMTKVGIYAILRVNGTIFSDEQGQELIQNCLLIIGISTSIYGVIGAMGAERLRRLIGFMVLSSIGTILIGLALFSTQAWAGALYYLVHSTLIVACFYLFAEWICAQRGSFKDHLNVAPMMKQGTLLSMIFLLIALMLAGLPPFSGFLGKIFILQGTADHPFQLLIIASVVLVSILSILALVRVGLILFWRASPPEENPKEAAYTEYQALPSIAPARNSWVLYALLLCLIAYAACAEPIYRYTTATAAQLQDKTSYQHAQLKLDQQQQVISVKPFDPRYLPETYGQSHADQYQEYIPYIISEKTLQGEHIPAEKAALNQITPPSLPNKDVKMVPEKE